MRCTIGRNHRIGRPKPERTCQGHDQLRGLGATLQEGSRRSAVKLVDLQLQSKDRMFRGEIGVDPSWEHTALRIRPTKARKRELGSLSRQPRKHELGEGHRENLQKHQGRRHVLGGGHAGRSEDQSVDHATKGRLLQRDDADPTMLQLQPPSFDDVGTIQRADHPARERLVRIRRNKKLTRDAEFLSLDRQETDQADQRQRRPELPPTQAKPEARRRRWKVVSGAKPESSTRGGDRWAGRDFRRCTSSRAFSQSGRGGRTRIASLPAWPRNGASAWRR